jgi:hypothetical protein
VRAFAWGGPGAADGAAVGGGLGPHARIVPEYTGVCMGGLMQAIAICMSANACVSCAFIATRVWIVKFFWMDALARLLSDEAIRRPCSSSSMALAPKVDPPTVM